MLLLDPPLPHDDWEWLIPGSPEFDCCLSRYTCEYESAVLSLPGCQLAKILAWLVRNHRGQVADVETFHEIVLRELEEQWWEASNKAASLVVLCALANSLHGDVIRVLPKTQQLLRTCRAMLPFVLVIAINDHYGLIDCAAGQHDGEPSDGRSGSSH
jgi:hypothetical protein